MKRSFILPILILVLVISLPSCDALSNEDSNNEENEQCCTNDESDNLRLTNVENDLLSLINAERITHDPPRPSLSRDPGMDEIIFWHVSQMAEQHFLNHQDNNGRESELRARYYGDNPTIRCSEIIQWWGGSPSGQVHYIGYFNSASHRAGYLEEGAFNLGPTSWAGVAAVSGTGPSGSQFEGQTGSYTGVMFCESQINLIIDPFSE